MVRCLHLGGLIAVGFDRTGTYLLTVSHSGRGIFHVPTWDRVARDYELSYPESGIAVGIGPIDGEAVPISELNSTNRVEIRSPDGKLTLTCESSGIDVTESVKK